MNTHFPDIDIMMWERACSTRIICGSNNSLSRRWSVKTIRFRLHHQHLAMCEWILFRKLWKRTIKKGPYFCRTAALRGLFGVHFFGFISCELSDIRRQRRFINVAFYRMLCKSDQMGCGKVGALECYLKRTTRVSLKRFFTMIKTQTWCPKAMLSKYFLLEYQVPHNISSQIGEDKIFRKTAGKNRAAKIAIRKPVA